MVEEEKKIEDLVIKLEISDQTEERYVDIELSYMCKDQAHIDRVLKAINNFIEINSEGLQRTNYNILGYSYS